MKHFFEAELILSGNNLQTGYESKKIVTVLSFLHFFSPSVIRTDLF